MPMQRLIVVSWMMCSLLLTSCHSVYMPVEPAYTKDGTLRTDGHFVKDTYLIKLNEDLKACTKP